MEVVVALGLLALRLAEQNQQSSQLRDADGVVVTVAIEEVLEHLDWKQLLTRRLSRHWARRAEEGEQGKQGEEDMMVLDEHDSSTGRQRRICGSKRGSGGADVKPTISLIFVDHFRPSKAPVSITSHKLKIGRTFNSRLCSGSDLQ